MSHLASGIIGALLAAFVFVVALGGRVIRLETRLDSVLLGVTQRIDALDKNLQALLASLGALLHDDVLRRAREESDRRYNR